MSRTRHVQRGGAKAWNPPKIKEGADLPLGRTQSVVSATEYR